MKVIVTAAQCPWPQFWCLGQKFDRGQPVELTVSPEELAELRQHPTRLDVKVIEQPAPAAKGKGK